LSREKLVALEKLQTIDLQIEALTKEASAGPSRVAELEAQVARARAAADAERGRLADNERARRHLDNQLAEEKDKVKKWEARLPQLKHQREFAALEREITSLKKSTAAAEEELNKLKGDADPIKRSLQEKEAALAEQQAMVAQEKAGVDSAAAGFQQQVDNLKGERDREKALVDAKLLAPYENARKRRGGKVLVPMVNSACSACNRRLPPQLAAKLHVIGTVDVCPACMRLVFVPPPPPDNTSL
jgi:predicted  nucleic acid-binding Zn-ribbon protein